MSKALVLTLLVLVAGCVPLPAPGPRSTATATAVASPAPSTMPLVASPTPEAISTATAGRAPRLLDAYPSPDDTAAVEVRVYDCMVAPDGVEIAYEELRLIPAGGGAEKVIAGQLRYCGGLGAFGLDGLFWSPDGRFFYFTDGREGVPDGGCGPWIRPVLRYDAMNDSSERLGNGPFSPDRSKLATWQGLDLVAWDVARGEASRARAVHPEAVTGEIAWSPDGRSIVYVQTELGCYPWGKTWLVLARLPDLQPELLLEREPPGLIGVNWEEPGVLALTDAEGRDWTYDLATGTLKGVP